ncbi:MAG: nucleotide exchange factor GrpE [Desulfatitalea sp.]|nr:nucleotide exchange factor GrpE [Desulfatitalea sp.]
MEPWQEEIERHCREWMAQLAGGAQDGLPEIPPGGDGPDLYAFFEALTALRSDVSKSGRRSHDTFARIGDSLTEFEGMIRELSDRVTAERQTRMRLEQDLHKRFLMPFAEMCERLDRLADKLAHPPKPGLLNARHQWADAWSAFTEGFGLLREHYGLLLRDAGVVPMQTVGQRFDPSRMKAVATEPRDGVAPHTVIEELAAGYLYKDDVLKFAEVKIAIQKGDAS